MEKKHTIIFSALAGAAVVVAIGLWHGGGTAHAQTAQKTLMSGPPGSSITTVPVTQIRVSKYNGRPTVFVSGSGNGIMSTCVMTISSFEEALVLEQRMVDPKTTSIQCLGPYASTSTASNLRSELDLTGTSGSFTLYSNP